MALPIKTTDSFGFEVNTTFILTLLATMFASWLVSLVLDHPTDDTQATPSKPKRKAHKQPPGAPVAKRRKQQQRLHIDSTIARQLFAEDTSSKTEDIIQCQPSDVIEEPLQPVALLPKINDLRTVAFNKELSPAAATRSTKYYTAYKAFGNHCAKADLWTEASKYDMTIPYNGTSKPQLTIDNVTAYVNSLLKMYNALHLLNNNKHALEHSGTGEYTVWQDGPNYKLIDMINHSIAGIIKYNAGLSKALKAEYAKYSPQWTKVPRSYVDCCELSRDAHVLANLLIAQHYTNANFTSWADW